MTPELLIGLAYGTAARMDIPDHLREEAAQEAILGGWEASNKFDPSKGVPEAAWIAMKMRWEIKDWLRREWRQNPNNLSMEWLAESSGFEPAAPSSFELSEAIADVERALQSLGANWSKVVKLYALGEPFAYICAQTHLNGPEVKRFAQSGIQAIRSVLTHD